jgi:hypothetical protein
VDAQPFTGRQQVSDFTANDHNASCDFDVALLTPAPALAMRFQPDGIVFPNASRTKVMPMDTSHPLSYNSEILSRRLCNIQSHAAAFPPHASKGSFRLLCHVSSLVFNAHSFFLIFE